MQNSQRNKLLISISLILLAAFMSLSIINYNTVKQSIEQEIISSSLPLLRDNIYSEIQEDFVPSLHRASMMSADTFLMEWAASGEQDTEKVTEYLYSIQEKYSYFSTFFVSAATGKYYHYDGVLKTVSPEDEHDDWFYSFIDSGKEYRLDVDTNEAHNNQLTIFVNYRLEDSSGNLLGVTGVGIKMENFSHFLQDKQEKYNRRIFLVNQEGMIQAHSDDSLIHRTSIRKADGISQIADAVLQADPEPKDHSYTSRNSTVLVTSLYMPELDWYLIVEQDEKSALSSARKNLWRTMLIGLTTSVIIIAITLFIISYYQKRLEKAALTDELTSIANRRYFVQQIEISYSRMSRYSIPLSVILFDIDHFKQINDSLGHIQGDVILRNIAAYISGTIRDDDFAARWGGDEFIIVVHSHSEEARLLAEKIRLRVRQDDFTKMNRLEKPLSLSLGIAECRPGKPIASTMKQADDALYQAKEAGRNCTIVSTS